jgi:galactonate dehydratase
MIITRIETFKYWIQWCNWMFVRVTTDEGLHGWGEGSLHGAIESVETYIHELEPVLIGQDPAGVEAHWQRMYHAWRWRGGMTQMTAIGALDMALWDIEGQRLGVPVYRLLGGPLRTRLRAYNSHWLRGVRTPEQAFEGARECVRRGFTAFKWNPIDAGVLQNNERGAIARATELMAAAREGAGADVDIFMDFAERLSPRTAVALAQAMAPYGVGFFEEPIPSENPAAMISLARELPVPIATGERLVTRWEVRALLEGGGCKILQPDLMHCGGISEVRRMATLADTYYVSVAPHNPAGPICTLAAMHLAASIPNFYILEEMEMERELRNALCTHPVICRNGYFELPDRPGLGTDLRLEALEGPEYAFRPQPVRGSAESLWH